MVWPGLCPISITIIADGVELLGNANLLDWRRDSLIGGLTGFFRDRVRVGGGNVRFDRERFPRDKVQLI